MISTKRRKLTSEFRAQVVLEVISGKLSVSQAANKYKIKDSTIDMILFRVMDHGQIDASYVAPIHGFDGKSVAVRTMLITLI
jgi:transposase-like protein